MSSTTSVRLVRINCNTIQAKDILTIDITSADADDYDHQLRENLLLLSRDQAAIYRSRDYWIWGVDGQRHLITLYYDYDAEDKHLVPNHRANALITAGRFTTTAFNDVVDRTEDSTRRNCNQELKDQWGSSFLFGDVICVINAEDSLPDFDIYGHNPIDFIRADRVPSQAMVDEFGENKAHNMIHFSRRYSNMPTSPTREELNEYLADPPYEGVVYPLFHRPNIPADKNYLALLQLWGYPNPNPPEDRPVALVQSLAQCEQQLIFALQNGGVLVFWSHLRNSFDWINVTDQNNYGVALKRLRKHRRNGTITACSAGDLINIDDKELHSMLVTFEGQQCTAYFLLRRRGEVGDLDYTPYFFTSRNSRDNAIEYINAPRG